MYRRVLNGAEVAALSKLDGEDGQVAPLQVGEKAWVAQEPEFADLRVNLAL